VHYTYIVSELKKLNDTYSEKLQSNKYNEKDLINLNWKIKELGDLNEIWKILAYRSKFIV